MHEVPSPGQVQVLQKVNYVHSGYTWVLNEYILVHRLKEAGIECPEIATGSTPACSVPAADLSGVTEFHPGNYVFYGNAGI